MTREEAIKTIETAIAEVEWDYPMDYAVAFEMAITALREQESNCPEIEAIKGVEIGTVKLGWTAEDIEDMHNELCCRCGNLEASYMGACDGCRWEEHKVVDFDQFNHGWIPVTERLPEEDGRYLCYVKSFAFTDSFYWAILQYDKYGFREGNIYTDGVTHWMPLPEPPKEG